VTAAIYHAARQRYNAESVRRSTERDGVTIVARNQ